MDIYIVKAEPNTGTYIRTVPEGRTAPTYSEEKYPEKTDTLCWHCCHSFEGRPIPLALSHDPKRNVYKVAGVFCSFGCMAAYNKEYGKTHAGGTRGMAIYRLYRDMTRSSNPVIPVAPPKQFLKCFGGWMDIDEFRDASNTCQYELHPVKCMMTTQGYTERQISSDSTKASVSETLRKNPINPRLLNQQKTKNPPVETLKLKRSGPSAMKPPQPGDAPPQKKKKTILEQTLGLC
jgi:hypothetical protein